MNETNIQPTRQQIHKLFMDNVMEKAPGYAPLKKAVIDDILPTPTGVEKILTIYTKKSEEISWEGHRKYIDIQYMLSGSEEMDVRNINLMKASIQYDEVNDFQFFNEIEENNSNPIKVNEDEFLVFFPKDIHKPCIGNGNKVKKIVVKVKL